MPKFKKVYAWKDGDKFYASVLPRAAKGAANVYTNPNELLRDASLRHLPVEWENPAEIDAWQPH